MLALFEDARVSDQNFQGVIKDKNPGCYTEGFS